MQRVTDIKRNGFLFYALVEQEIPFVGPDAKTGDILIFQAGKRPKIGGQLAVAETRQAALEYIDSLDSQGVTLLPRIEAPVPHPLTPVLDQPIQPPIDTAPIEEPRPQKRSSNKSEKLKHPSDQQLAGQVQRLLEENKRLKAELSQQRKDAGASSHAPNDKVVLSSSGAEIRVFHERPKAPPKSKSWHLWYVLRYVFGALVFIAIVLYIAYNASLHSTMQANGIDVKEYSQAVLQNVRDILLSPFGF